MTKIIFLFFITLFTNCKDTRYILENQKSSLDELFTESLICMTEGDSVCMDKLIMNRKEHNEMFWNHVGERFTSDPNLTPDLAYDSMSMEMRVLWRDFLKDFKGKKLKLLSVKCNSEKETYGPFKLVRGCNAKIENTENAEIIQLTRISNLIEYNGKFKIYNFKRD